MEVKHYKKNKIIYNIIEYYLVLKILSRISSSSGKGIGWGGGDSIFESV